MLSHLKRRVALLSVFMLAATTLALVPASPAFAAVKTPQARAQFSACPTSASIPSAGFTDTTSTDVDCVAYYGITTGTTATTYAPTESVTRWQMALFLTRAAVPAGVTLGAGTDDGSFTDVSGKSAEIITAIYQIKELGISIGSNTAGTTFSPDGNVNREEMALFIERFLAASTAGPGGADDLVVDDDSLRTSGVGVAASTDLSATNYTDIATGTTFEGRNAIVHLWHMGITDDPSSTAYVYSTTYSPGADMTRAAMATFLTAALAHTNARPKGVSLQSAAYIANGETASTGYAMQGATTAILSASYRADDFTFSAGTLIDVFSWLVNTTVGSEEFLSTGLCNSTLSGKHSASAESVTICYIDAGDQATNANGNTTPSGTLQTANKTHNYYAWTGATGTSYDNDLHLADASTFSITGANDANEVQVSSDIDAEALTAANISIVPFGTDITISVQAEYNNLLADANTTEALVLCSVAHTRVITLSGNAAVYANGTTTINTTAYLFTDATGAASYTITSPTELSTTAANDTVTDTIVVTCADGVNDGSATQTGTAAADWSSAPETGTGNAATSGTHGFKFMDTAKVMSKGALAQSAAYGTASTSGVTRTATYTSYDQYGNPWAGEVVTISSSGSLIDNPTVEIGADTFTTISAHGLAVGDDLTLLDLQGCVLNSTTSPAGVATALTNGAALTVSIVTTSTTFALTDGTDVILASGTGCNSASDGMSLGTSSFAAVTRTTGSAGTASVSWSDTEGTSGVDTVYAAGTTLTDANSAAIGRNSSEYYRTVNATATANTTAFNTTVANTVADWTVTDATDSTLANRDASGLTAWIEYWDNPNDVLVVGLAHGEVSTGSQQTHYVQYKYDSTDQFSYGATAPAAVVVGGTHTSLAYFEYYMGLGHSNATDRFADTGNAGGGQAGPVHVDYEVLAASTSVFILG